MAEKNISSDILFLGIDGGGSKSRATLVTANDEFLGTGVAGPANPFQDMEQAFNSVLDATHLALKDAGLNNDAMQRIVAGIGLAGVNLPRFYQKVSQWQHPFKRMFLATDLHIACLGAHAGQDGAVIVAGTGSCGYSYVNGQSLTCGAHGFPFGDKGSGAWIGLEAFKAVLLASDGLGPATSLEERIADFLQVRGLSMIEKMAGTASNHYAKLAPLVFAAAADGDAVASEILEDGAAYLSAVCNKLWQSKPPRMSLLGGLGQYIVPWFDADIAERLSPALQQPEYGAICFAQREWEAMGKPQAG